MVFGDLRRQLHQTCRDTFGRPAVVILADDGTHTEHAITLKFRDAHEGGDSQAGGFDLQDDQDLSIVNPESWGMDADLPRPMQKGDRVTFPATATEAAAGPFRVREARPSGTGRTHCFLTQIGGG